LPNINLADAITQTKSLKLSDFCSTIEYLPLETSIDGLIGTISKIKVTKSHIFVLTTKPEVYVFYRNGKFLRQIGFRGKGPAEYNYISDIAIDEVNKEILVFATLPNKALIYSFDGVLKKNFKIPQTKMVDAVECINPGLYLFMISNYMGATANSFEIFGNNGEIKGHHVKPKQFETKSDGALYLKEFSFYKIDNAVFSKENILNDTIYKFSNLSFSPFIVINSGKYTCNVNVRMNPGLFWVRDKGKYIVLQDIFETSRFLIFEFWLANKTHWSYFDKSLKKAFSIETSTGINNDYDPAIPFKPAYQMNSELIGFYSAEELTKLIRGKNLRPDTEKALRNISEEDNPVIIIAKLKANH
jgi:hypothetical protein